MSEPDFDLRPQNGRTRQAPPRPAQPPRQASPTGPQRHEQRGRTVNKTRNGGGFNPSFNINPSVNISKGGPTNPGIGPAGSTAAPTSGKSGVPGASFMSNEDIHAFAEHVRKEGRTRAAERAMDAEQLEEVLRHIPDTNGSLVGARMRARRVSRHLKRIAKAEQLIAKEGAALYASFEREYDAELRKVGRGRPAQSKPSGFGWR